MLSPNERWEHGGAIELPEPVTGSGAPIEESPFERRFATARQAFASLLHELTPRHTGATLWLPDLWCHTMTHEARRVVGDAMVIAHYPASPQSVALPGIAGDDVLLVSSLFGHIPQLDDISAACVIADLSHGLIGNASPSTRDERFDYSVTSLRKLCPVPDGAVLSARTGHPLPPQPSSRESYEVFARELTRLLVAKSRFLRHGYGKKADFYPALADMEASLGGWRVPTNQSAGGRARSRHLNPEIAAVTARQNCVEFTAALGMARGWNRLATPTGSTVAVVGDGTFICLTCGTSAFRDRLRAELISRRVWPAILWPVPDDVPASESTRRWVGTSLVLNADARYGRVRMHELAEVVAAAVLAAGGRVIAEGQG